MIYSIGYQRLTPDRLVRLTAKLRAPIVDVRSNPSSRKPGFSRRALHDLLGPDRYIWAGDVLGGRPPGTTNEGIAMLMRGDPAILMCLEEAPGDCHRHHAIAVELLKRGIDVRHIYTDQLVRASDLSRTISLGVEYPFETFLY